MGTMNVVPIRRVFYEVCEGGVEENNVPFRHMTAKIATSGN